MTPDEFFKFSCQILNTTIGWQSGIARKLGVDSRTVRRWLKRGELPDWVGPRLVELSGGVDPAPYPRDEWIFGKGQAVPEYIIHTEPPRFIGRVVALEMNEDADLKTGTVYGLDAFTMLCEINWIDRPSPNELSQLMEAAADAWEAFSESGG